MDRGAADVHFASRVATQSLRMILAFSLLAMFILFAERFLFQRQVTLANATVQNILDARAEILLSDEQLTMSALAFAQSGNDVWHSRYKDAMHRFNLAVKKAADFAPEEHAEIFKREFGAAHEVMHELEQLVIDLTEGNERTDAVNVFTSPRYLSSKHTIESEINKLLATAEHAARQAASRAQVSALVFVIGLAVLTIVGFFWLSRRLKLSLSAAEKTFESAQADYLNQLAANHEVKLKSSRMEQLGTLTATLAHELRNPLGAVRTSSFMLERHWQKPDEGVKRAFERIKTGIWRCDNLITQLLEFSRLGSPQKNQLNFDNWLEHTLKDMAKNLHHSINLSCTLNSGAKQINMDAEQLRDALFKVLTNATEAMIGRDGKLSTFNGAAPLITVETEAKDDKVSITITDNGHGIAEDVMGRVMDPFFTTKSFGLGLGLPAVKHTAEQHEGALSINSTAGAGTTVRLILRAA